jgi:hypothetical protein
MVFEFPSWPYSDLQEEFEAIRQYLTGRLGKLPYSIEAGRAAVLYEHLRHHHQLFNLKKPGEILPEETQTAYEARISEVIHAPGFPEKPFIQLAEEYQQNIILYFLGGQPSVRLEDIRLLKKLGVLDKLQAKAEQAFGERRLEKGKLIIVNRTTATRNRIQARIEREPGLEDMIITVDYRQGKKAAQQAWEQIIEKNSARFASVRIKNIARQRKTDPRLFLKRLVVARLLVLCDGYKAALEWALENQLTTPEGFPIPWYGVKHAAPKGKKSRSKFFFRAPYRHKRNWSKAAGKAFQFVEDMRPNLT